MLLPIFYSHSRHLINFPELASFSYELSQPTRGQLMAQLTALHVAEQHTHS